MISVIQPRMWMTIITQNVAGGAILK